MPDAPLLIAGALYLAILFALALFGLDFMWLTWVAVRRRPASPPAVVPTRWPSVTVQLPVFNELYVAERLIDAAARFDYPGKLEIQVLDDSTDETVEVVARAVARWRATGVAIEHIRRVERTGFKAGALGNGLSRSHSELLAIFDADFIPPPGFLTRAIPVLCADPGLAFVQARWGHTNRDFSLLTRLQSLSIDGHMVIEQYARWQAGQWFNFNGTAGVWRRSALVDAGGWSHDTLTEDLDISYRAFLRGWRAAFMRDLECPAEIPASFSAYRRQQHRWARGTFECAIKHLPAIWRSRFGLLHKFNATVHLLGYSIHLLLLSISLLYPVLLLVSDGHPIVFSLFGLLTLTNLTALAPGILFTQAQRQLGRRWWTAIPSVMLLTVLGAGMMVNTARAFFQAVGGRPAVFERTPKFGLEGEKVDWSRLRYQPRFDGLVAAETLLAVLNVLTSIEAIHRGFWAIALYAAVFATGLTFGIGLTVSQAIRGRWIERSSPATPAAIRAGSLITRTALSVDAGVSDLRDR